MGRLIGPKTWDRNGRNLKTFGLSVTVQKTVVGCCVEFMN